MALSRMTFVSEKQTHRKLSASVGLGQFSTQSGLDNLATWAGKNELLHLIWI
jgi:hypothetical protein